jgi:hypothetical protein
MPLSDPHTIIPSDFLTDPDEALRPPGGSLRTTALDLWKDRHSDYCIGLKVVPPSMSEVEVRDGFIITTMHDRNRMIVAMKYVGVKSIASSNDAA